MTATNANIQYSLFTKPWKTMPADRLASFVRELGFEGIEFPLRDGYQLEPAQAGQLPQLAAAFAGCGLRVFSVASSVIDERVFAGCAEAGIPLIRFMPAIDKAAPYSASLNKTREQLEALLPLCVKYGVQLGCQQHYGGIPDTMGLLRLLEGFDPARIGAIWDAAHDALAGQQPEYGLDTVWPRLCMVNLKNAMYMRTNGPEAAQAEWKRYFTSGRQGLASWPRAANYLKRRGYEGVVCLTAEYTNEDDKDRLIRDDIAYAKSLFQ